MCLPQDVVKFVFADVNYSRCFCISVLLPSGELCCRLMADSDSWYDNRRRGRRQLPHSTSRSLLRSPQGNVTFRRSMLDGDAHDKVEELTTSLKATSEVLTTADRMLEHYKQINTDQDDEIQRVTQIFLLYVLSQAFGDLGGCI